MPSEVAMSVGLQRIIGTQALGCDEYFSRRMIRVVFLDSGVGFIIPSPTRCDAARGLHNLGLRIPGLTWMPDLLAYQCTASNTDQVARVFSWAMYLGEILAGRPGIGHLPDGVTYTGVKSHRDEILAVSV